MLPRTFPLPLAALLLAAPAAAQMSFVEVAEMRGLGLELGPPAVGTAVGDVNGDGWLDVAFFGTPDNPRPRLYINRGAGVQAGTTPRWFHERTAAWFSDDAGAASAGIFADMDNDGDKDLVVVRRYYDELTGVADAFDTGLQFYENRGGRFRDHTAQPYLGRAAVRHGGIGMADTDVDGDLDIVFVHNGGDGNGIGGPGFYVMNEGWPRFPDNTAQFGAPLGDSNRYFTPILADFNGDMLPDVHIAVDFYMDFHCRNMGGGVFQDVTLQAGTTNLGADMGSCMGDIDNDGDLDIYQTNINYGVLYVNDGTGTFVNDANNRGCGGWGIKLTIGWGTTFADLDLDRDQDLAFVSYGEAPGHLYENDGTGHFTDALTGSGLGLRGHGLIPFDYDRDGDQDLLVTRVKSVELYENSAADMGGHWLGVTLEGTQSNREGVGAKVEVESPDGLVQTRWIVAGYSYLTGPPIDAHFGLGASDQIKELRITWPTGQVDTYGPLTGDQYMHFVE